MSIWYHPWLGACDDCAVLYKIRLRTQFNKILREMIPVTSHIFDLAVVSLEGNVESNDCVASFNELKVFLRDVCLCGSSVKE